MHKVAPKLPTKKDKPNLRISLALAFARYSHKTGLYFRPGILRARQLLLGATDLSHRSWLLEGEAKNIVKRSGKGYTPTFFEKEGVWRSGRGYFRLWENKDGAKGLVFGFHHDDLDIEAHPNPSFTNTNGVQHKLKKYKGVHPVIFWPAGTNVKLGDILKAINNYSDEMRQTIADETILYETDPQKGVFRSGGVAYVLRMMGDSVPITGKTYIGEVSLYLKVFRNRKLVNPFGENILERLLLGVDPGIKLFNLLHKQGLDDKVPSGAWRRRRDRQTHIDQRYPLSRSRERAEFLIFRDYHKKALRYLYDQDPVSPEEIKLNRRYYITRHTVKIIGTFLKQGKYYIRKISLDDAANWRNLFTNLFNAARGYLIGGALLILLPVAMAVLGAFGMLKPKINHDILMDLKDPLVDKYSSPARRIKEFATLLRELRPESFDQVTMLSKPTFDESPPRGIKSEPSFDVWPSDLIENSLQERGRSIIRFCFNREAQPSSSPEKDVRAYKVLRADGIITVKFIHENIVWGLYTGESFDPRAPKPPSALLDKLKPGYVLQINNCADPTERETYIPLRDAERFLQGQFKMPLIEPGIARPQQAKDYDVKPDSLHAIKNAFQLTADELAQVKIHHLQSDNGLVSAAQRKAREKLVKRILRYYPQLAEDRRGIFQPFVTTISDTIKLIETHKLKYEFFSVGKGLDHTIQFYCALPNNQSVLATSKNGGDLEWIEQGVAEPLASALELNDRVQARLAALPPKPESLIRRIQHHPRIGEFRKVARGNITRYVLRRRQKWQPRDSFGRPSHQDTKLFL